MAVALSDIGVEARSWLGWQIPIRTSAMHGSARIESIEPSAPERAPGAGAGGGDRGLSGHRPGQPHHDARPRRLGYLGGGGGGGAQGRPLRHLHRCGRRLHHRSAHRAQGAAAGKNRLRGNAGDGVARRQGPADALRRNCHASSRARSRAIDIRCRMRAARFCATRKTSWKRNPSPASPIRATKRRSRCIGSPTSRAIAAVDLRAAGRCGRQCRHDRPERLGRRQEDGPHLHLQPQRACPCAGRHRKGRAARSATRTSRPTPMWRRSRSSASACARIRAWPRRCSARSSEKGINIQVISTSEIKVSVLIAEEYVELAVRALHSAYELDSA